MPDFDIPEPIKPLKQAREELVSKYRILPEIDSDGYSQCPFAEDLYAEKEEKRRQVQLHLDRLVTQRRQLYAQISKARDSIGILDHDKASIHSRDPYEEYEYAQQKQHQHLKMLQNELYELELKINDLEILLGITDQKQWPGRKPVKGSCFDNYSPSMINRPSARRDSLPQIRDFNNAEIDSVFERESRPAPVNLSNIRDTDLRNGKVR